MLNLNEDLENILIKSRSIGRKLKYIGLTYLLSVLLSGYSQMPTAFDESTKNIGEDKKLELKYKSERSFKKQIDLGKDEYYIPKFVLKIYKIIMVPNSQFWPKSIYIKNNGLNQFKNEFFNHLSNIKKYELKEIKNYFNILSKRGNTVFSDNSTVKDQYHELVHKVIREDVNFDVTMDLPTYRSEFLKNNKWIYDYMHPAIF